MKKIILLFLACTALPAAAHALWLEQADNQTRLYFGEYDEGLHEKTGGRLDTITAPAASLLTADSVPLVTKRAADFIAIEGANNQPVIAHDLSMKVKDYTKYHWGFAKPMYYARISHSVIEIMSNHALDIQPAGTDKVRINLNGHPLPKAKVKIVAPNQWAKELEADDNGEVTFALPWEGLYVFEVVHLEASAGEYQGDKYENIRHVSTLSVVKK